MRSRVCVCARARMHACVYACMCNPDYMLPHSYNASTQQTKTRGPLRVPDQPGYRARPHLRSPEEGREGRRKREVEKAVSARASRSKGQYVGTKTRRLDSRTKMHRSQV